MRIQSNKHQDRSIFIGSFDEAVHETKELSSYFWSAGHAFHATCSPAYLVMEDNKSFEIVIDTQPLRPEGGYKEFDDWAHFGLRPALESGENRFEMVLPQWCGDTLSGTSDALKFAEGYAKHLGALQNGYRDLNDLVSYCEEARQFPSSQFSNPILGFGACDVAMEKAMAASALWKTDKFSLAYNDERMHFLECGLQDLKHIHQRSPDRISSDFTAYPLFAILSGQQNWLAGDGRDSETKLLNALTRVSRCSTGCVADEFIAASAGVHCDAIRNHQPSGFVAAALLVAGCGPDAVRFMNWSAAVPEHALPLSAKPVQPSKRLAVSMGM